MSQVNLENLVNLAVSINKFKKGLNNLILEIMHILSLLLREPTLPQSCLYQHELWHFFILIFPMILIKIIC